MKSTAFLVVAALTLAGPYPARADQVIADNLISQSSLCIGFDCVNGESFGFDTVRLKENNTRIYFHDTSSTPGEPAASWWITANDSASGGASYLGVEEISNATMPFRVMAGAPTGSFFVTPAGRLGVRSLAPALDLHLAASLAPGLHLEQTGAGGTPPAQQWSLLADHVDWRLLDATSGRVPFRLAAGAPHNSLMLATVGVATGTPMPAAALHAYRFDGSASLLVEEAAAAAGSRLLLALDNAGPVQVSYRTRSLSWNTVASAGNMQISPADAPTPRFRLDSVGNLTISGMFSQGSSRALKDDVMPLDIRGALAPLAELPVFHWRYKEDAVAGGGHIGPIAETFHERLGLGLDGRTLAPGDVAAFSMAAIQSLNERLAAQDGELAELLARLDQLEARASSREVQP